MPSQRDIRMLGTLIGAMVLGAVALHLLEPPQPAWASEPAHATRFQTGVDALEIEYVPAGGPVDLSRFDCLIYADGAHEWRPRGSRIRVGVVGDPDRDLSPPQARKLLAVIGTMWQSHGLDLAHVALDPNSDPRHRNDLPPPARDLYAMLARKGIVN